MAPSGRTKAVKPTPAGAEGDPPAPKPWHLPSLAALAADTRTELINVAVLVLLVLIVPVVAVQFLQDKVIIQPSPVPDARTQPGLTPDVAGNRLRDGLNEQAAVAATSKQAITVLPASQRVDFAVPDTGISIGALVYHARHFFHAYPTLISSEFRCADAACIPQGGQSADKGDAGHAADHPDATAWQVSRADILLSLNWASEVLTQADLYWPHGPKTP